jgi:hypothetical protein
MAFLVRLKDLLVVFVMPLEHGAFRDMAAYQSVADDRKLYRRALPAIAR